MKRGEIWTASGGGDYTGKSRPVVVVQDDLFSETESVTVCPFTSDSTDLRLFRIAIELTPATGLRAESRIMADKVTTVPRTKLCARIGRLSDRDLLRLNRAVLLFLGLAS